MDGAPSANQVEWVNALREEGYMAEFVWGWESAKDIIVRYLGEIPNDYM